MRTKLLIASFLSCMGFASVEAEARSSWELCTWVVPLTIDSGDFRSNYHNPECVPREALVPMSLAHLLDVLRANERLSDLLNELLSELLNERMNIEHALSEITRAGARFYASLEDDDNPYYNREFEIWVSCAWATPIIGSRWTGSASRAVHGEPKCTLEVYNRRGR